MPDEIQQCLDALAGKEEREGMPSHLIPLSVEGRAVDLGGNLICDCEVLLYRCGEA